MKDESGYESFEFVAEYYDYVIPYRDRPDVRFYVEEAESAGGPVLEVGCGTGRILIPTARAGVPITGTDYSEHMLEVCRQRLAQEPEEVQARVHLQQADMRALDLRREFPLITIPFRAFQHIIDPADQITALTSVRHHLAPGGRLILDVFNPWLERLVDRDFETEFDPEPEFAMSDGRRVTRKHRIVARNYARQINYVELIYYVTHLDGRTERLVHAFPMRYFFRYEVEHLLARCGFEVEELYADFERNPFGTHEVGELIFVAQKR